MKFWIPVCEIKRTYCLLVPTATHVSPTATSTASSLAAKSRCRVHSEVALRSQLSEGRKKMVEGSSFFSLLSQPRRLNSHTNTENDARGASKQFALRPHSFSRLTHCFPPASCLH